MTKIHKTCYRVERLLVINKISRETIQYTSSSHKIVNELEIELMSCGEQFPATVWCNYEDVSILCMELRLFVIYTL